MSHAGSRRNRALRPGVEYEYDQVFIHRDESLSLVTRILVQKAESGGWELDRVRIAADGHRRIVLRRKIIRQQLFWYAS